MTKINKFPRVRDFANSISKTDVVFEELSDLSEQELDDLNQALSHITPEDPISEWGGQIRKGNPTNAFAEIVLVWHSRRVLGSECVELNAEYTDTGKDFDLRIRWNKTDYWIDVRTPKGALSELEDKKGGYIAGDSMGKSIMNKLRSQFKTARRELPDDAVLVLAVYLQASLLDKLLIPHFFLDASQNDDFEHPGEYCDAFFEYVYNSGKTTIDVRELTHNGENATQLRDKLNEDQ